MRAAVWCAVLAACVAQGRAKTVMEMLEERPDLSQFLELARGETLDSLIMEQQECTVFVPTNDAMQKFKGFQKDTLLSYHRVNVALPTEQLVTRIAAQKTIVTGLKGNQAIFVTVQSQGRDGPDEIFVNSARIVRRDLRGTSAKGYDQIMHVIDAVLEPTFPNNDRLKQLFNPSALDVLQNSAEFHQTSSEASIRRFNQKVKELNLSNVFNKTEGQFNTFFIPADDGMDAAWDSVNKTVVDAHIIPGRALFTSTMGNETFETMAFGEMPKVVIRLREESFPKEDSQTSYYEIQSTTILGDEKHLAGTVLAKVIRPNIIVSNGVVHIIEKPLVTTETTVLDYLQERKQDKFYEFINLLENSDPEFLDSLRAINGGTIFVPSNEAFYTLDEKRLTELKLSQEKLRNLLDLHLSAQQVTMNVIRKAPQAPMYSVPSRDPSRPLHLAVSGIEGLNQSMTVEAGGFNASVVVADIVTRDGVIQVIDKLLGVPYRSVGDKLAVDPTMSDTNRLASRRKFGDMVRRMDNKFTMLVPSNDAWEKLRIELPTSHKNLFGNAFYQARSILERHLLIGEAYDMEQLVNMTTHQGNVRFFKTQFAFERIPGDSGYLVKWQGQQARITRSDVECTNGFIHVIDSVFMRPRDVTTTGGAAGIASSAVCLVMALAALRL